LLSRVSRGGRLRDKMEERHSRKWTPRETSAAATC